MMAAYVTTSAVPAVSVHAEEIGVQEMNGTDEQNSQEIEVEIIQVDTSAAEQPAQEITEQPAAENQEEAPAAESIQENAAEAEAPAEAGAAEAVPEAVEAEPEKEPEITDIVRESQSETVVVMPGITASPAAEAEAAEETTAAAEAAEEEIAEVTAEATEAAAEEAVEEAAEETVEEAAGETAEETAEAAEAVEEAAEEATEETAEKAAEEEATEEITEEAAEAAAAPEAVTEAEAEQAQETETAEEPAAAEQEKDWSAFYNEETGSYELTFRINEDAEGDQTIDLTNALVLLNEYARAAYKGYEGLDEAYEAFLAVAVDDNALSTVDNALEFLQNAGLDPEDEYVKKYASFMVDTADYYFVKTYYPPYYLEYFFPDGNPLAPSLGTEQANANHFLPGDTVKYSVKIESESGHTYKYKEGSFVLATPAIPEAEEDQGTGVYGFDGQELPEEYVNDGINRVSYTTGTTNNTARQILAMHEEDPEAVIDPEALFESPVSVLLYRAQLADAAKQKESNVKYYSTGGGATRLVKSLGGILTNEQIYALASFDIYVMTRNDAAVSSYLKDMGYWNEEDAPETAYSNAYKAFLVDYYSEKDGTEYADFDELVNNSSVVQDLKATGNRDLPGSIELPQNTDYNNFYNNCFSFAYGDEQIAEAAVTDSWNYNGNSLTVGDYMNGYLRRQKADYEARKAAATADSTENSEADSTDTMFRTAALMAGSETEADAWAKANNYFEQLLAEGLTDDEASWAAFNMAFNIDGQLTGNDYQNTLAAWHNTLTLDQIDGAISVVKTDEQGETITDSETGFRLWYYEDSDSDGRYTENDSKYFYTVTTVENADGSETKTPGFVKYIPGTNDLTLTLDLTVMTEKGELNIDKTLLEGIIYYMQEIAAPEGYELDATVYIICDSEDIMQTAHDMLQDISLGELTEKATALDMFAYAGKIDSDQKLEVKVVNVKSPEEPEEPEVPETPEEPEVPETPEEPEEPEVPETPEEPEVPETPEVPAEPETPAAPAEPAAPATPAQPEAPAAPEEPVVVIEEPEVPLSGGLAGNVLGAAKPVPANAVLGANRNLGAVTTGDESTMAAWMMIMILAGAMAAGAAAAIRKNR